MRDSADYREFWARLNRGEYQAAEYKRIGKGGKEVWILATYNPILDENGKPFKVVKFATDVTDAEAADRRPRRPDRGDRQVAGGDRVQHGRHDPHRQRELPARRWAIRWTRSRASITACSSIRPSATARPIASSGRALNRGEYQAAEYKRIGKGGREVWIQASYNPILDLNGKPFKVVKYATDTTAQVIAAHEERARARHDGVGRRRRRGTERLGAGDLRSDGQVEATPPRPRSDRSKPPISQAQAPQRRRRRP